MHTEKTAVSKSVMLRFRAKSAKAIRNPQIQSLSKSRKVGSSRGNGLYHSTAFEHFLRVEGTAGDEGTPIRSVGIDAKQPFNKKVHSCVQLALTCEDLDIHDRYLDCNSRLFAILPGPKESNILR